MEDYLFDKPQGSKVYFSDKFSEYRTSPGEKVTWSPRRLKTSSYCEECIWYLHENQGKGPNLRQATLRRQTKHGSIDMCYAHAYLWKQRDDVDKGD